MADALSRCNEEGIQCHAIHSIIPTWKQDLRGSLQGDNWAQDMIIGLKVKADNDEGYTLVEGDLKRNGKLYVGTGNQMREQIIKNIHSSAEGGHSGISATTNRIEESFYWPTLRAEVAAFVRTRDMCQ